MGKETRKFDEIPNSFMEYMGKPNARIRIRRVRPINRKPKLIPNKPKGFADDNRTKNSSSFETH